MAENQRPMDMSGLRDRSKGERMKEPMIRFKLVNGDSYTLLGDEAVNAHYSYRTSTDDEFMFRFEDKIVTLYGRHIVGIERRGIE